MNDKKNTDDNEFSELKKILKEIPKVNAPDNFEFNLMTKIQNQNFEVKSEKKKNIFSWALTPAIAFAASVFLIFFVFSGEDNLEENPWSKPPQLIGGSIAGTKTDQPKTNKEKSLNSKTSNHKSGRAESEVAENSIQKKFPFDKKTSVSLDDGLKLDSNPNIGSAQLVGTSEGNSSPFNGFFLREVEKHQKKDSLENENDSTSQMDNK